MRKTGHSSLARQLVELVGDEVPLTRIETASNALQVDEVQEPLLLAAD